MTTSLFSRLRLAAIILAIFGVDLPQARAQDISLARGDAVVTGFSGVEPLNVPVSPGANPLDTMFINLDGASAEILALSGLHGGPQGQLEPAPVKRLITAGEVGQVFAVALDDGLGKDVPDIYLGATSVYGIQIVAPGPNGNPKRLKTGAPGAQFMAGQFGPAPYGSPGTIWRVDSATGAVSVFANIPGNSGPGIGDIVFDRAHQEFFASDLDSGLIYRISATGQVLDSFDHGVNGRLAESLAPVADDGKVMDITSPSFDSENPATWGYTQKERMVWGMAVHDGRLYYAVDGQVWSIGLAENGDFAGDPRWELDATALPGPGPITDMLFDHQGRMYLVQRGEPRGSYDYSVFAKAGESSVVRYSREEPDNPATPGVWAPDADQYAIGMRPDHRFADGGIALGYAHDPETGALIPGSCDSTLWTTGSRLRSSEDPDAFDDGIGPADVHGLQGNDVSLVRPQNVPPTQAYYIDDDGLFGEPQNSGHIGNVAIWQPCDHQGFEVPGMLPPGFYPPGGQIVVQFPHPHGPHTNLRLTKHVRGKCVAKKGGWSCSYEIRIKNTGPHPYFAPLEITDHMPGLPPGAIIGFSPQPPWHCWPTGPNNHTCARSATFIPVGGSRYLVVAVWVPGSYPKPGHCDLHNVAHIIFAPGGSPWNTNPADDTDGATAIIPAPQCHNQTNLQLRKKSNGPCKPVNPAGTNSPWACDFTVRVKNTGPSDFHHTIKFVDQPANGTKITNVTVVNPQVAWNCNPVPGAPTSCKSGSAVHLLLGQSKFFHITVLVPKAIAIAGGCKIVNSAHIIAPFGGSSQNINSNDDADAALASIPLPANQCSKNNLPSNLKIEKTYMNGTAPCKLVGGVSYCTFKVTVTNTGPGKFTGPIWVHDVPSLGTKVWGVNGGNWSCTPHHAPGMHAANCHINVPNNNPLLVNGQSSFTTWVRVPKAVAQFYQCHIKNRVRITAPLGAPKNWNPADDYAQAAADINGVVCASPYKIPPPPKANLKLEKKSDGCKLIGSAKGAICEFTVLVRNTGPGTFHDNIDVSDQPPAGTTAWGTTALCSPDMAFGGAKVACHSSGIVTWQPNQGAQFHIKVAVPKTVAIADGCKITNSARIVSPLGSLENVNPGDDADFATATIPAALCRQSPARKAPPPRVAPRHRRRAQCPLGTVKRGSKCVPIMRPCPRGTVRHNGKCVLIERNQRVSPPRHERLRLEHRFVRLCPRGTVRHKGRCVLIKRRELISPPLRERLRLEHR